MNEKRVEEIVRELLIEIGEDPNREGLVKTPKRIVAALAYLTSGYRSDVETLINGARFTQQSRNMIVVKNIEIYSL